MNNPNSNSPPRYPSAVRRWSRRLVKTLWHGLAVVGLGAVIYLFGFDVVRVTSGSMSPTLVGDDWKSGDTVLIEKFTYRFREPRRWEVMAFRANDGARIMKRVIGLPGETVRLDREGEIFIDGRLEPRPDDLADIRYVPYGNLTGGATVECQGGYYVLGDDSRDSEDSRFEGSIPPSQIIGRAWWILAPAARRGPVAQ